MTTPRRRQPAIVQNSKKAMGNRSNWYWTNERHMHFLDSMEASFVRSMLENYDCPNHYPRLDRYLPDTSDSTQDLGKERRRRHSTSDVVETSDGRRTDKKTRRSAQMSSQDQVVPQIQSRTEEKGTERDDLDACHGTVPLRKERDLV